MAKIENDKYYTSPELAKYCVEKTKEIIGSENITEYIEPSAGSGVFLNYLDKPYLAYDIEPEDDRIIKQDWLENNLTYKKGRCVIGNPPFGNRNTLSVKFYKKAIQLCDYISFILPFSQFEESNQLYEFNLIYSEDLGVKYYTDRNLHCCFNIYCRPIGDKLNKKENIKLKDIYLEENRRNGHQIKDFDSFDYKICSFGKGIIGKVPKYKGYYVKEMYFKILNNKLKSKIMALLEKTNWESLCKGSSGQYNLTQNKIYKYLKEQIPELK
jgi:hypothetical protein